MATSSPTVTLLFLAIAATSLTCCAEKRPNVDAMSGLSISQSHDAQTNEKLKKEVERLIREHVNNKDSVNFLGDFDVPMYEEVWRQVRERSDDTEAEIRMKRRLYWGMLSPMHEEFESTVFRAHMTAAQEEKIAEEWWERGRAIREREWRKTAEKAGIEATVAELEGMLKDHSNDPLSSLILLALGKCTVSTDLPRAVNYFARAAECPAGAIPMGQRDALGALETIAWSHEKLRPAIEASLDRIIQQDKPTEALFIALVMRARMLQKDEPSKAIALTERGLAFPQECDIADYLKAQARRLLANLYEQKGRPRDAVRVLSQMKIVNGCGNGAEMEERERMLRILQLRLQYEEREVVFKDMWHKLECEQGLPGLDDPSYLAEGIAQLYGREGAGEFRSDIERAWHNRRFDIPPNEESRGGTQALYSLLTYMKGIDFDNLRVSPPARQEERPPVHIVPM